MSNYNGEQVRAAQAILKDVRIPLTIEQSKYSMLNRSIEENGCLDATGDLGIGMTVFSPLEQGLLTNRYLDGIPSDSRAGRGGRSLRAGITPEMIAKVRKLNNIAEARGQSLARMALSWVLRDSRVHSLLVGASSPKQLEDTVKVLEDDPLSVEELQQIEDVLV